jgi:hypothetical protein
MPKLAFRTVLALAVAGVLAGCQPVHHAAMPGPPPAASAADDGPLASTLQVAARGDSVHLSFQVTNAGTAPVALTFPSGQFAEFTVSDGARELWRWSADRMFTQAVRNVSLAPGETRAYEADWARPAGARGQLTARAWLTAQQVRAERSASFTLP